jgi:hypothetical protein
MAATIYIIYKDADGSIVSSRYGDPDNPPAPGTGETCLNAGSEGSLPTAITHKVDIGQIPHVLVAKTQSEIDAERNNLVREEIRRQICMFEAAKDKYAAHSWPTTDIDAKIAELIATHDAIPV